MDDQVTPRQFIVFLFALAASGVWASIFVAWTIGAWRIMSRALASRRPAGSMQSVYIPVSQYGTDATGMENDHPTAPGIDAPNTDMPRLSRTMGDGELIVVLALLRGKDGKHRFSANDIQKLIGGDRNTVLARVKELRATPPPAEYMQPDGTKVPGSYPVTRRTA
jgi:hypothetical protein